MFLFRSRRLRVPSGSPFASESRTSSLPPLLLSVPPSPSSSRSLSSSVLLLLSPGEAKVDSWGGSMRLRGDGCTGIQQVSEWPNSLHSRVHFLSELRQGDAWGLRNRKRGGFRMSCQGTVYTEICVGHRSIFLLRLSSFRNSWCPWRINNSVCLQWRPKVWDQVHVSLSTAVIYYKEEPKQEQAKLRKCLNVNRLIAENVICNNKNMV